MKAVLRHVALGLAVLAMLWALLALAAAIPNEAIRSNMLRSAESYSQKEAFPFLNGRHLYGVQDNYADTVLLGVAWNMGVDGPLNTRYFDGHEYGEHIGLYQAIEEGAPANTNYTRYWHGSAMVIRPLMLLMDGTGIKLLGLIAVLVLAGATCAMLCRRGHWPLAAALAVSLAAVHVWNLRFSLEYQSPFVLAFLLCPLFLGLERRGDAPLTLLSVAAGVMVAFFDFLTTETYTVLLPLALVLAVRLREGRLTDLRSGIFLIFCCGGAWLLAYGSTFVIKWIAATIVTGENQFITAFASVAERFGGVMAVEEQERFYPSVTANLTVLFGGEVRCDPGRAYGGLALSLSVLGSVYYLFRRERFRRESLVLLVLALLVPLRFLVLNNHSYLHEFFTYRALGSSIFALLALLVLNTALPQKKGHKKGK